MDIPSPF